MNWWRPNRHIKVVLTREIANQAIEIFDGSNMCAKSEGQTAYIYCDAYWRSKTTITKEKTVCVEENTYDMICAIHDDLQHAGIS